MYNEINELFNEMTKAFEGISKKVKNPILLDVIKNEDSYSVLASLPGVNKEDVKLSIEDSNLTISVEPKKEENKNNERKFVLKERIEGYSSRPIYLKDIDETTISAKMEDGILNITVPFKKRNVSKITIEQLEEMRRYYVIF